MDQPGRVEKRPGEEKEEEEKKSRGAKASLTADSKDRRPRGKLLMRSKGVGEQDAEVAAWTITRDENSWSALLTLTDTGNQAVSCMPAKPYKRLCFQNGQKYALEEYPVPIIGVGSKRIKVPGKL